MLHLFLIFFSTPISLALVSPEDCRVRCSQPSNIEECMVFGKAATYSTKPLAYLIDSVEANRAIDVKNRSTRIENDNIINEGIRVDEYVTISVGLYGFIKLKFQEAVAGKVIRENERVEVHFAKYFGPIWYISRRKEGNIRFVARQSAGEIIWGVDDFCYSATPDYRQPD
ncbi:MAG: hypothetical protein M9962_02995 [Oligoflexia bacterium]|nr:hypothetical protein [Oligoflexia bacterium]